MNRKIVWRSGQNRGKTQAVLFFFFGDESVLLHWQDLHLFYVLVRDFFLIGFSNRNALAPCALLLLGCISGAAASIGAG
jgi:hypothetical protein